MIDLIVWAEDVGKSLFAALFGGGGGGLKAQMKYQVGFENLRWSVSNSILNGTLTRFRKFQDQRERKVKAIIFLGWKNQHSLITQFKESSISNTQ